MNGRRLKCAAGGFYSSPSCFRMESTIWDGVCLMSATIADCGSSQIGQLAGQNGFAGKMPVPLVKPPGDQRGASLEVHEADPQDLR